MFSTRAVYLLSRWHEKQKTAEQNNKPGHAETAASFHL